MKQGEEADVVNSVLNVFMEFVAPQFSYDGVLEFKKFVTEESIAKRFQSGNPVVVAMVENNIIGVIEMRDNSHMALLFVKKSYQKKGAAKELLFEAIKLCKKRNQDIQKLQSTLHQMHMLPTKDLVSKVKIS